MTYRKKLIEVALPLEVINRESAREKRPFIKNHPRSLHLWWARRPLAACRAVLFASLVDDPSSRLDKFPTEEAQETERQRLFKIIEELVKWENTTNETILEIAREEIRKSTDGNPPPVLDPFCGGGSIPLEAQRLGLEAHASDLNPVAVLITKAMIEIPPRFAGKPPIHLSQDNRLIAREWRGAQGLAEDVRYYGQWMRDEAFKQIGHLYPKVKLLKEYGGGEAKVVAWLWARTVKCPNPACGAMMPLVRSFALSTKKGKETYIQPVVDKSKKTVQFEIRTETEKPPNGTVRNRAATCTICGGLANLPYIRSEGKAGRLQDMPLAIVAEGNHGRIYIPPDEHHEKIAHSAKPKWKPDEKVTTPSHDVDRLPMYGMFTWGDAFTPRQLVALTTFSDLVREVREKVLADARKAELADDGRGIDDGGSGATAYADSVATYLAFAVDRLADYGSTICSWDGTWDKVRNTFARQAIQMTWDFAENNLFSDSTGNFMGALDGITNVLLKLPAGPEGHVKQLAAQEAINGVSQPMFSTDPPYYDNIGYADLSDFFYVWLRQSIGKIYQNLFKTLLVPKQQELVAASYRFDGSKERAQRFFEEGLGRAFAQMQIAEDPQYPLTVFYAFKQAESQEDQDEKSKRVTITSTGWETMLEGLLKAQFQISGTWPMRTEQQQRMVASGTNALASSIALICRPRLKSAKPATSREFGEALRRELPEALEKLQQGNIAPVDLAQAAIGPGMAIFTRYSKVLEDDGSPMRVRKALAIINQILDEVLAQQDEEFDGETRWAITWFEQYAFNEETFGTAETLSKARNTSIDRLRDAGILLSKAGKVRLLKAEEYVNHWNPRTDSHRILWKATHQLIHQLETGGEVSAGKLLAQAGTWVHPAKDLAYRLYGISDRSKWAEAAMHYNALVASWPEILKNAKESPGEQTSFT